MVKESVTVLNVWPLMSLIPSAALVSLVLGFNLLPMVCVEAWKP